MSKFFSVGDGSEIVGLETSFENALDIALAYTSGNVEFNNKTWEGRGKKYDGTVWISETDAEEYRAEFPDVVTAFGY